MTEHPTADFDSDADSDSALTPREGGDVRVPGGRPTALQVARGVGGMALVWGGGWTVLNGALVASAALLNGWPISVVIPTIVRFGVWGSVAGAIFALILSRLERSRSVEELSLFRVGAWGAVGTFGLVFMLILVSGILPVLGIDVALSYALRGGLLGAGFATLTTWIAKQAPND